MEKDLSMILSGMKGLTTYHYKVILYLNSKNEATQTEMSEYFNSNKQTINKACKDLLSMDIIRVKYTVGKNIFLELNHKPNLQHKGQIKMDI